LYQGYVYRNICTTDVDHLVVKVIQTIIKYLTEKVILTSKKKIIIIIYN